MTDLERLRAAYPPLPDTSPPAATLARLESLYASHHSFGSGAGPEDRGRRRLRPSRRIGLLAIGGVILAGTAVAATGGWHPVLGSPSRGPQPLAAHAPVPADQLAALAVLRRPQTATDRGPLVQQALRVLNRQSINGIQVDAIRVVAKTSSEISVLVPAERAGPRLKGVPASVSIQRNVLCLMSAIKDGPAIVTQTPSGKLETLPSPQGYNDWGSACGTLQTLRTSGIQTAMNPASSVNAHPQSVTTSIVVLVPDGVASANVRLRGGRSVTVPVHNNVYSYTIHGSPANLGTTWLDTAGHRIDHRKHP
jgi:hypothetical protein